MSVVFCLLKDTDAEVQSPNDVWYASRWKLRGTCGRPRKKGPSIWGLC